MIKYVYLLIFTIFTAVASSEEHIVKMLNSGKEGMMVFEPAVLSVKKGDTVKFVATDVSHNSASIEGMIPEGAKPWTGALNQDIEITLTEEGVYVYQCTPHNMMAMVGVIQVGNDKSNLDTIKTAATQFKSLFVMNQSRLDDYLSKI